MKKLFVLCAAMGLMGCNKEWVHTSEVISNPHTHVVICNDDGVMCWNNAFAVCASQNGMGKYYTAIGLGWNYWYEGDVHMLQFQCENVERVIERQKLP